MKSAPGHSRDTTPPSFEDAANLRQRACAAGMDPAYWYPVEWEKNLASGKVQEVKFWNTSVALYRAEDGKVHAIENRCAHRQVKLSHGWVEDCRIKCVYHGWTYGPDGKLEDIPHDLFGKPFPSVKLKSYPVQVRYGIIWVFFGDPALMAERPLPEIPEVEGEDPWIVAPTDFLWHSHATMIVNNVMDSTHVAALHSRAFMTRSMLYGRITQCEAKGDEVSLTHDIQLDPRGVLRWLGNLEVAKQHSVYQYPYLWVSVGGTFKLWNLLLPIDERTTRIFLLSCAKRAKIPGTPFSAPRALDPLLIPLMRKIFVRPLFEEDGFSTRIEQEGYEAHWNHPAVDPHPAMRLCYELTVRKWEEHLARSAPSGASLRVIRR